jgi:putrescine aminotransferase
MASPAAGEFTTIARGEGAAVWDAQGRRYVDAVASMWYCNAGHGQRAIADAVAAQLRALDTFTTFERFTNEPAERLCATLAELAPMDDARVFLASGGSEAVEMALKLARLVHQAAGEPERRLVVARPPSFHGVTEATMAATGTIEAAGFVHVDRDDLGAVRALFAEHGHEVAAFLVEPVICAGGVFPPAPGYLEGVRALCDEHGALLVFDEIVTAFGRLGAWWGAQRFGVVPDLATFAKGVSSGVLPLGGVVVASRVHEPLAQEGSMLDGYTYSGHPVTCAAAQANIEVLREQGLLERADPIGERLAAGLAALQREGLIAGARGVGAIHAAELQGGDAAPEVRERMLDRGVIARPIGERTIAFCPPLVIGDEDLDRCVEALEASLRAGG